MNELSIDEAIKILKIMCTDNFCIEQLKTKQAIETILDLYKQEKEKNKKVITYIKEKQKIQYKYALSQIECDEILELLEEN